MSGKLDLYSTHTHTLILLECLSDECDLKVSVSELLEYRRMSPSRPTKLEDIGLKSGSLANFLSK